jgi:hypothetical protein
MQRDHRAWSMTLGWLLLLSIKHRGDWAAADAQNVGFPGTVGVRGRIFSGPFGDLLPRIGAGFTGLKTNTKLSFRYRQPFTAAFRTLKMVPIIGSAKSHHCLHGRSLVPPLSLPAVDSRAADSSRCVSPVGCRPNQIRVGEASIALTNLSQLHSAPIAAFHSTCHLSWVFEC